MSAYASIDTYKIGLLLDNKTDRTTALIARLQEQIKAVVGEDAKIIFPEKSILVNHHKLGPAQQNYHQLITNDTDIIIAFGVVNNEIISKLNVHKKPTILFGAVNQEVNDLDISKKTSGIKNFTYLIESESYRNDLQKLKQLTKFKKVGILVDQPTMEFLPLDAVFTEVLSDLDATYKIIPITGLEGIRKQLDDVDAVYLAGGFFLKPDEVKALAQLLIEYKLPSFTLNNIDQIENGIMASHSSSGDIDQFFRRIALTVETYISGVPLSEMPVFIDFTHKLTINFNTANAIGVPIKYSLISETDFVGEMINTASKKQYDLVAVINQVLEKNRSLASTRLNVALTEQDVNAARSEFLPDLSAGVAATHVDSDTAALSNGSNPEYSTSSNINLSQLVYSEGVNASIDIQKALQKAEQENYNVEELNIIFDAVNTYFTTLILKSNLQTQLQNLNLTKENLNLATQSFEVGESSKSDMLRFQSQKAQNTQALVEARSQLKQSFISLNKLLYNPIDYEVDIVDINLNHKRFEDYNYEVLTEILDDPKLTKPFVAYLVERAKGNAPELKALAFNINATERDIMRNGARRYLPTVSLQAQYNRVMSRHGAGDVAPPGVPLLDDGHNLTLNFSVPLFNKNQFNINQQRARLQKQQLEVNKQNTELSINANVHSGVLDLINQISNISLSKISEQSARETLDLTQASYQAGAVNVVQLIDAQNNHFQSQLSQNNAIYNFLISSLQLQRFIGYYFLLNSKEKNNQFRQQFFEYLNAGRYKESTAIR